MEGICEIEEIDREEWVVFDEEFNEEDDAKRHGERQSSLRRLGLTFGGPFTS